MADLLAPETVAEKLEGLPGWSLEGGKLHRSYRFADFRRAFAFMSGAALARRAPQSPPRVVQRVVEGGRASQHP